MPYSDERLSRIFDRTDGRCHLCHGELSWDAYGDLESDDGWEVEHSLSRGAGGTDHLNNLYAAHPRCNRSKGARSTRSERQRYNKRRAPRSRADRQSDTLDGAIIGGALGLLVGPGAALLGAAIGALAGYDEGDDLDNN